MKPLDETKCQLLTDTPGSLGVSGMLNFETAGAALQAIQAILGARKVDTLDLADLRHSDSAGLACIVAVMATASRSGVPLKVLHVPEGMQALARVCEVAELID